MIAAVLFAVAGALFIVYPVLRPYSSEVGVEGAIAFGSNQWVIAHVAAMAAFACLAAACCFFARFKTTKVAAVLGTGLILPYYGAETFGLHAIGTAALQGDATQLAQTADALRYNPVALTLFACGWIALAVAGVALSRELWLHTSKLGAVLVGAGLLLYLPQFFGPSWMRITHGAVLGVGLLVVTVVLSRARARE